MKCPDCKTKMDQEGETFDCPSCGKKQKPRKKKRRSRRR
jgi:predicted RNA-binding Zn-ribbon protein involved in translation (DUF1610 family)